MTSTLDDHAALEPIPDGFDRWEVEQFLYREARYADEADYDSWEALWTDDALYWVPVAATDDPSPQSKTAHDHLDIEPRPPLPRREVLLLID